MEYCHDHHIILYCLPSHTTHALQPLDIVLFSPLKQAWAKAVASEEFDGRKVTKENFLKIYGIAHLQSFTLGNILASFRKSGIWPLDPTIITAEMMAPSTVESMDINAVTPIDLPSPVKQCVQYMRSEWHQRLDIQLTNSIPSTPTQSPLTMIQPPLVPPRTPQISSHNSPAPQLSSPRDRTSLSIDLFLDTPSSNQNTHSQISMLFSSSSAAFLLSPTHSSEEPRLPPPVFLKYAATSLIHTPITDSPSPSQEADSQQVHAENEILHSEVSKIKHQYAELEAAMEEKTDMANAQLVLMATAMDHSLEQLAQKEKQKSKNSFHLRGGKPVVLTNDAMIDAVRRDEAKRLAEANQRAAIKVAMAAKKTAQDELRVWRKVRSDAWEAAKHDNETLLEQWEADKTSAHEKRLTIPPKPHLALQKEVYQLADGIKESDGEVGAHTEDSEPEETNGEGEFGNDDDE